MEALHYLGISIKHPFEGTGIYIYRERDCLNKTKNKSNQQGDTHFVDGKMHHISACLLGEPAFSEIIYSFKAGPR